MGIAVRLFKPLHSCRQADGPRGMDVDVACAWIRKYAPKRNRPPGLRLPRQDHRGIPPGAICADRDDRVGQYRRRDFIYRVETQTTESVKEDRAW